MDTTGYIAKILKEMPHANNFAVTQTIAGVTTGVGDGLNTAAYRYVRGRHGNQGANVTTGTDLNTDRWQFNGKVDHNFNAREKLSGAWTYEKNQTDSDVPNWPDQIAYTTSGGLRCSPSISRRRYPVRCSMKRAWAFAMKTPASTLPGRRLIPTPRRRHVLRAS